MVAPVWAVRAGLIARGHDPANSASWEGERLRGLFRPMPAVVFDLVEDVPGALAAASPRRVLVGVQRLTATPWCFATDGLACAILVRGQPVARLFVWCDWLQIGPTVYSVVDRLIDFAEARGWKRFAWCSSPQTFVSSLSTGDLELRLPGDVPSAWEETDFDD